MTSEYELPSTPTITFSVWLPHDDKLEMADLTLPLFVALSLYQVVQTGGPRAVYDMFYLAVALRDGMVPHHVDVNRLWGTAKEISNMLELKFRNNEEFLLDASYNLLKAKRLTREEVADLAKRFLGKEITTNAWRKKTDRWAELQNLPPLGQTKRRPRRRLSGHPEDERPNM